MSDCCGNSSTAKQSKKVEEKPKSFIGKFLYNRGKKLKEKDKKKNAAGCC